MVSYVFYWTFTLFVMLIAVGLVSVNDENKEVEEKSEKNELLLQLNNFTEDSSQNMTKEIVAKKLLCPRGFHIYKTEEEYFCFIFINNEHSYPPACPYPNYLPHDHIAELYSSFKTESLWVRAYRNIQENLISPFMWTEPTKRYGEVIFDYSYSSDSIFVDNCMTIYNGTLKATNCNETHKALCIYSLEYSNTSRYCNDKNPEMVCLNSNLNIDSGECYCRNLSKTLESRNGICESLAEPRDFYQSLLILSELPNNYTCWFGLYNGYENGFRWSSDNSLVDYLMWSNNTNFNNPYGAFQFVIDPGWVLTLNYSLQCGLCQINLKPVETASVSLRKSTSKKFVAVYIRNPTELSNYFGNHFTLFCFSDMNLNGFSEKVTAYVTNVPTNTDHYYFTIPLRNLYPATYWCEGFSHPNMTFIKSSAKIMQLDDSTYSSNYALQIDLFVPVTIDPLREKIHINITEIIRNSLENTGIILAIRPLKFLNLYGGNYRLLTHISTIETGLSLEEEMEVLQQSLEGVKEKSEFVGNISSFHNSYFCLESISYSEDTKLTWPKSNIGFTVIPNELCLLEDSSPVTRTCTGDFMYGGQWLEVNGSCTKNLTYPDSLIDLHNLLHNYTSDTKVDEVLLSIVENISDPLVVEIHLMAQILNAFIEENWNYNLTNLIKVVSALMDFDEDVLKETQLQLNSTDLILDFVDNILMSDSSDFDDDMIKTSNLVVNKGELSTFRGLAVYSSSKTSVDFETMEVVTLDEETTKADLLNEDIRVAVFVSNSTYNELVNNIDLNDTTVTMMITFFSNHKLFNSEENRQPANEIAVSIVIPSFTGILSNPIAVIFDGYSESEENSCAYWEYGVTDLLNNIQGSWETESILSTPNNSHMICYVDHLTHFSLLVIGSSSSGNSSSISEAHAAALEIITLIGCILSYAGLLAILLTAVLFRRWKKHSGNTIILNFSICLTAQMTLTFIADIISDAELWCTISAIFLHYFILSEFCWMLVISFLQYRKFVTVFQQPAPHLVARATMFGWLFPLLPVSIVLIISPSGAYQKNSNDFCYIVDNYYNFGVLLPVALMVAINITIFSLIMMNVCSRKVKAYGAKAHDMKLQFLLAFLLFFLLGLSWIFGLLTAFTNALFFAYLFCITATLQGFVMFVFFIVMNENARRLWLNLKKFCYLGNKDKNNQRKASCHFSTTSVSTLSATVEDSKIK